MSTLPSGSESSERRDWFLTGSGLPAELVQHLRSWGWRAYLMPTGIRVEQIPEVKLALILERFPDTQYAKVSS